MTFASTSHATIGFEFKGFEPTHGLVSRAKERMSRVFGESPSDSATFASLEKTSGGFIGRLQIRSAVGTFVADVIGEDPVEVVNRLSRKVRSQLRLWKRHRALALDNF